MRDKEIWERGKDTPHLIFESLDYAAEQINFSNYDTGNIERAKVLLRRYFRQNRIPLGRSKAQRELAQKRKTEAFDKKLEACKGNLTKMLAVIMRRKNG